MRQMDRCHIQVDLVLHLSTRQTGRRPGARKLELENVVTTINFPFKAEIGNGTTWCGELVCHASIISLARLQILSTRLVILASSEYTHALRQSSPQILRREMPAKSIEIEVSQVDHPPLSPSRIPNVTARRKALLAAKAGQSRLSSTDTSVTQGDPDTARRLAFSTTDLRFHGDIDTVQKDKLFRTILHEEEKRVQSLRDDLARERIPASAACNNLIEFVMGRKDLMVPSVHGHAKDEELEVLGDKSSCCVIL